MRRGAPGADVGQRTYLSSENAERTDAIRAGSEVRERVRAGKETPRVQWARGLPRVRIQAESVKIRSWREIAGGPGTVGFRALDGSPCSTKGLSLRTVYRGNHSMLTVQGSTIGLPGDARSLPVEDVQGDDPHGHDVCGQV